MSSNLDVVRGVYAAFAVGNIPGVLVALAPNIQWTEAAGGPYGGVSVGPNAVLENVFMKIGGEWDGFAAVPSEFVEQGSTVVALGEYSGTDVPPLSVAGLFRVRGYCSRTSARCFA